MGYRPYVDTTLYPPFAIENVPNINYFTLGFIVAGANGEPCWGGYYPTSSLYYQNKIEAVRKKGGDFLAESSIPNGACLTAHLERRCCLPFQEGCGMGLGLGGVSSMVSA